MSNDKKIAWIKAVLANDENSTDEELKSLFVKEARIEQEDAEYWVNQRQLYAQAI